jgi:DNA-binding HxlR family transcriptional regulator
VVEIHRTSWERTGYSAHDYDCAVLFDCAERDDGMVIFRASGRIPPLDRGRPSECTTFVTDDTVGRKASGERDGVFRLLGGKVRGDGLRQVDRHDDKSSIGEWHYTGHVARTHTKVRFLPKGKQKHTEASAAKGVEEVLRILEGRWKLVILFHLFGGKVRRFSELRRAIPAVSEKMLIQQLRQMERDGVVRRFVHHQVPPKVEYSLTDWGQALCPALDALLKWVGLRETLIGGVA